MKPYAQLPTDNPEEYKRLVGLSKEDFQHLNSKLCVYIGFKLECLKIKHKTNHFAMRAKLFVKANQMAYEELQKLRAA
ncbi:hypothetical protein CEK71_18290 [Methylovulum psychrotolerans]|uniref:Uncharacterized protein n=1 Tax=Methylovulum psychrotolerans TaxID=1704499 RepID=A0A1Z4C2W9_9GAMM|nr:hypothetical protein [Methylovulum psychrotolerans]ASF47859.1 hypothetical protein CEK71_18290 [Methylovulum psychrotolerans]